MSVRPGCCYCGISELSLRIVDYLREERFLVKKKALCESPDILQPLLHNDVDESSGPWELS